MFYLACGVLAAILALPYKRSPKTAISLAAAPVPSSVLTVERPAETAPNPVRTIAIALSFAVLAIPAALRFGIGTDYLMRYVPIFYDVDAGRNTDVDVEPGYLLVNRLVAHFTDEYQWVFAIMSIATIALVYRFILRNSAYPALSILLYVIGGFYLESFNLVRQGLAVAIILNTVEHLVGRRLRPFILLTLLAATFHYSALIWLLTWPVCQIRFGRTGVVVKTIGLLAIVFAAPGILQKAISLWAPAYERYFSSNYGVTMTFDPRGFQLALLLFVMTLVLLSKEDYADRAVNVITTLQGAQIAALVAGTVLAYAYSRLTYYFTPIQLLIVPLLLSKISRPALRALTGAVLVLLFTAVFYQKFLVYNAHEVLPYRSIFDR